MPGHNVIYYSSSNSQIPLAGIANLPYTDVILSSVYPDDNGNLQMGGDWTSDASLLSDIQTLQSVGQNVLISFGGAGVDSAAYQICAQNVNQLVNGIVGIVNQWGFNGVDIDYEDNAGFQDAYEGITFLDQLTSGLAAALPPGQNIITHAPQTAYWDGSGGGGFQWAPTVDGLAPYAQIWNDVGNQITWINNQFYNTPYYDQDDPTKVTWYQNVAAITGPQKLLMGLLLSCEGGGEGCVNLNDVLQIVPPLQAVYGPPAFGGVMAWQFSFDNGGSWANGIADVLELTQGGGGELAA
jgi:chitinase